MQKGWEEELEGNVFKWTKFASREAEHLVGASSVSSSYISHKNLPLTIEVSAARGFSFSVLTTQVSKPQNFRT